MPVVCAEARPYLERLPGCDEPTVSPEEAEFFRRNGFLVKRGMASREEMARISEYVWDTVEATGFMSRHDPKSWMDEANDEKWTEELTAQWGGVHQQSWKMGEKQGTASVETAVPVGDHARIQSLITPLTAGHPRVRAPVEALLGTPLKPTELTRGVCAPPAVSLRVCVPAVQLTRVVPAAQTASFRRSPTRAIASCGRTPTPPPRSSAAS
eukprot:COSAG04_NODE_4249_length_2207_cov_1.907495_2_plen_211_part_00